MRDAFEAYAAVDLDQSQLALVVSYGHFSELMPEVRRGRWRM